MQNIVVAKVSSAVALAFALVLAGCLSVQGGLNASAQGLGDLNITVNDTVNLPENLTNLTIPLNSSDLTRRLVPQNATVCVFGAPDGLSETYFGSIEVLGEKSNLLTKFLY